MEKLINVSGAITDKSKANQKAWKILEREFPVKFFYGCVSYEHHSLVKDIFAATKTKKGGFQCGYISCGISIRRHAAVCRRLQGGCKCFHNHCAIKANLNQLQ
jgi:hypothetical protein